MGLIALTLVISAPMQLAAAAGLELAGGYDSTVLNPNSLVYGDGGIARAAIDLQVAHQTEYVRQLLRNRSEFLYTGGEGRSFTDSDFLNITRYALQWDPTEDWKLNFEGLFIYGRTSDLLTQGGTTDLAFLPGIYADYAGHLALTHDFGDFWRGSIEGGVAGRAAISIPPSEARENSLSFWGQLHAAHDFTDDDVGMLTLRAETFVMDGFPNWVDRLTGFAGWAHSWSETTATQLNLGVDALQDQNDTVNWQLGPYLNAGVTHIVPEANLVFGAVYRHEYAMVAAGHCAVPVFVGPTNPNGVCPNGETGAGGTGIINAVMLSAIWRPEPQWTFAADVQGEYGTTVNSTTDALGNALDQTIPYKTITASVGARWRVAEPVYLFARYDFLYQYTDPSTVAVPMGLSPAQGAAIQQMYALDIVRHVIMLGVEFVISSGEGPLEGIVPLEEMNALQGARMAGDLSAHAATQAADHTTSGQASNSSDPDDQVPQDPFNMSAPTTALTTTRSQNPTVGTSPPTAGSSDTGATDGSQGDSPR